MSDHPDPLLSIRDLHAGYGNVTVIHGLSIQVGVGHFVTVIGPNGAGKSTLLKAIYGLIKVREGKILYCESGKRDNLLSKKPHEITALGINYVPQLDNIFPNMSVEENLQIGGLVRRSTLREQLDKVLQWFPTLAPLQGRRAATLSGGQQHLLGLARALMSDPKLLLLDEPSAGLSPQVVEIVFMKIKELNDAGIAMVLVEQNAKLALSLAHHAYVLEMGRNRLEGSGHDLLGSSAVVSLYLGGDVQETDDPIGPTKQDGV